jgi:uncharacterized protein GlcG (DUF336 family)
MKLLVQVFMGVLFIGSLAAATPAVAGSCDAFPKETQLQTLLATAPTAGGTVGGLFNGTRMWGAVVDRDGSICAFATSLADRSQVWPGSQAIAKAKAYTANAFSLDSLPLSTARLYTFTQPGHSLFGLNNSNPFVTDFIAPLSGSEGGKGQIAAGIISFGGGVPLYKNGKIIGGLGVSGDTACADHEIAKRVRSLAGLNPPPPGGSAADDISYSSADGASVFTHPLCVNTYRNGIFIGDELPAVGY